MNIKPCDIYCTSLCTNNYEPAVDSDCNYEIIKCNDVADFLGYGDNKEKFKTDSAYAATAMKSFCNFQKPRPKQQQEQRNGGNTNKKQRRKRRNTKKKRRINKKK